MPDARDVIRACQRVIVWRRQTLIDENRKASRNMRLARKLRVVLRLRYFFCDALLFGALALGVLGTIGELILASAHRQAESMDPDCSAHIAVPVVAWHARAHRLRSVRTLQVLSRLNGTLHEETPSFRSCAGHPGGARDHERTMNPVY
jgi:hypothetical protein